MDDDSRAGAETADSPSGADGGRGSRRARFRAFVGNYPAGAALADAWDEHRRYVGFAATLFAFGVVIGAALALAGYNLLEMLLEFLGESPLPDVEEQELTARFFIVNNTQPFLLSIFGAITIGLLTAWLMVFNGVLVGNVAAVAADAAGLDFIFVALAPHGVFELPALFVAAGVGFRLLHRFAQRVRGTREAAFTKPYLYRTGLFVLAGWLMLVAAAFLEAYVTTALLEALFPEETGSGVNVTETGERLVTGLASVLVP